jgi:FKBP-type peptidyl-prolyl cis-trans isomerase FkpA
MKNPAGILLSALMLVSALTAPDLEAQTKTRAWKKQQKVLHLHGSALPQVLGKGTTTPSGLTYWDIQVGAGEPAVKGKIVKIRYKGWNQSGNEFANSSAFGEPSIFKLGAGQVIQGWEQGVEGMKVGGKRQLRIPPELAYGNTGREPSIPPNSTLTFEIELIGVQ